PSIPKNKLATQIISKIHELILASPTFFPYTTLFRSLRQPIKHRHTTANINSSLESDTKHSPFHVACSNSSPVTISFFSKSTCKWILLAGSTKTLTSDKNCGKGQNRCIPYSSKSTAASS